MPDVYIQLEDEYAFEKEICSLTALHRADVRRERSKKRGYRHKNGDLQYYISPEIRVEQLRFAVRKHMVMVCAKKYAATGVVPTWSELELARHQKLASKRAKKQLSSESRVLKEISTVEMLATCLFAVSHMTAFAALLVALHRIMHVMQSANPETALAALACRTRLSHVLVDNYDRFRISSLAALQSGRLGALASEDIFRSGAVLVARHYSRTDIEQTVSPALTVALHKATSSLETFRSLRECMTHRAFWTKVDQLDVSILCRTLLYDGFHDKANERKPSPYFMRHLIASPRGDFEDLEQTTMCHPGLVSLEIGWYTLGEKGTQHVCNALAHVRWLRVLSLANTKIGSAGARLLQDGLALVPALTQLSLQGNLLGVKGIKEVGLALIQVPRLRFLDLSQNGVQDHGVIEMRAALARVPKLRALRFSNNEIGAIGASHLKQAFARTNLLRLLDLDDNPLGAEGLRHIAEGLRCLPALQDLRLNRVQMTADGAEQLGRAFRFVPRLSFLGLRDNQLQAKGMHTLGANLAHLPLLESLALEDNDIRLFSYIDAIKHVRTPVLDRIGTSLYHNTSSCIVVCVWCVVRSSTRFFIEGYSLFAILLFSSYPIYRFV